MATSAAAHARAELEKQLVELSRLRNANTRDPDFKVWRQGTLTLIQRLWEGDDSRSGRFRAVPFSPASTRADSKLTREWFERGCAEAAHVIRDLIEEINAHGIIKGPAVSFTEPEPLPEDESVPILSLDSSGSGTGLSSIPDEPDDLRLSDDAEAAEDVEQDDDELLEIPDPPGARQPKPMSRPIAKEPVRPKPPEAPRLPAVKPRAPEPRASANVERPADPHIPKSETAAPGPSRGVTVSSGGNPKNKRLKERLMDMLGFEPGSKYSPPAQQKSPPAARAEEKPQPPRAEQKPQPPRMEAKPQPPRVEEPPRPPVPAIPPLPRPTPTHSPRPAAPAARAPGPRPQQPGPPPIAPPRDESFGTVAPESVDPLAEGGVSEDFAPSARPVAPRPAAPRPTASRPATPPSPAPPAARVPATRPEPPREEPRYEEPSPESEATSEFDEERLQRAFEAALESVARRNAEPDEESKETDESEAEDLLGSSPVFNVSPRPAQRRGREAEGRYHTATSIAMAAIATEVEAMGVPASDCPEARAALLELADHFERRDLTWDTVRDAVRLLVEYPVVARRVLPLLVPHLDEAA